MSYNCCRSEHEKKYHSIDSRKLDLFYRTIAYRWEEVARYEEDSAGPGDEFEKLADNAKHYQIIVVDSVTKLGRNVNELIASIKKAGLPIYSLQEGLLYIDGEERIIQSNTVQPGIDST